MRTFAVDLGPRSHSIYLGRNVISRLPELCASLNLRPPLAIVTDRNVASLHLRRLLKVLRAGRLRCSTFVMPAGERQKSLGRANAITTWLLNTGHTRSSPIAAFGGGVVGDVTGFVASTYRRGSPFIQIPTTLLGQVESSIGGKVGVNHPLAKNAIGTFYQPRLVLSDVGLLAALPPREVICGLGEILKYALLDAGILSFLETRLDSITGLDLDTVEELVALCNAIKARLISEDERETDPRGGRNVLNLGHRIGHALEHLSRFRLHHGEAVVVGLRLELALAREAGIMDPGDYGRIRELMDRIGYSPDLRFIRTPALIAEIFGSRGKATFVLPERVGSVTVTDAPGPGLVRSVLKSRG